MLQTTSRWTSFAARPCIIWPLTRGRDRLLSLSSASYEVAGPVLGADNPCNLVSDQHCASVIALPPLRDVYCCQARKLFNAAEKGRRQNLTGRCIHGLSSASLETSFGFSKASIDHAFAKLMKSKFVSASAHPSNRRKCNVCDFLACVSSTELSVIPLLPAPDCNNQAQGRSSRISGGDGCGPLFCRKDGRFAGGPTWRRAKQVYGATHKRNETSGFYIRVFLGQCLSTVNATKKVGKHWVYTLAIFDSPAGSDRC